MLTLRPKGSFDTEEEVDFPGKLARLPAHHQWCLFQGMTPVRWEALQ